MIKLFKKRGEGEMVSIKKKPARELIDVFIENLREEREKKGKGADIEVLDRQKIVKNCGKSYLELFKVPLIEVEWNEFFFLFRDKEKRSFWYSIDWDRIVVNFARSPVKEELQKAEKEAREFGVIEAEFKIEQEKIKK